MAGYYSRSGEASSRMRGLCFSGRVRTAAVSVSVGDMAFEFSKIVREDPGGRSSRNYFATRTVIAKRGFGLW